MRLIIASSSTALLVIAAVIALPTVVKAQTDTRSEISSVADASIRASSEQIGTEMNYCFRVPGYGWRCV